MISIDGNGGIYLVRYNDVTINSTIKMEELATDPTIYFYWKVFMLGIICYTGRVEIM